MWRKFLTTGNLALLLSVVCLFILWYQPRVVTVDVSKIVRDFSTQLGKTHLSDTERKRQSKRFSQFLQTSLNDYSEHHRVTLITHRAVFASRSDVTSKIERDIRQQFINAELKDRL